MSFLITDLKKLVSEYLSTPTKTQENKQENNDENDDVVEAQPINDKKYFYLNKEDLTMEFGFDRDLTKTYLLNVCVYQINKTLEKPFLEFYVEERNSSYEFIQKTLYPNLFAADDESDIEEKFLEQCEDVINNTFSKLSIDYNGFIEIDDKIYAFYENIGEPIQPKLGTALCIIDEIINTKKILDFPIHESIINLFNENQELVDMEDEDNSLLENPIVAYLCKKNGSAYENIISESSMDDIDTTVSHEKFGNVYLFTKTPINSTGTFFSFFSGSKKPKRFALFLDNSINLDTQGKSLIEYLAESLDDYNKYSCISYTENGTQYWVVRSKTLFTEIAV
jgi:hypothetical protein